MRCRVAVVIEFTHLTSINTVGKKRYGSVAHSFGCDISKPRHTRAIRPELGHSPCPGEPHAHRSRSISDVSSFSTVFALSFGPIRVRALCV